MIFLSASIPIKGREYYGTANIPAIREAVMAFTKVCMDFKLPFYFGGHPAISPLVYQIAKEYGGDFATNVKIYQSMWFHGLKATADGMDKSTYRYILVYKRRTMGIIFMWYILMVIQ